jgi:hypothetical protein
MHRITIAVTWSLLRHVDLMTDYQRSANAGANAGAWLAQAGTS